MCVGLRSKICMSKATLGQMLLLESMSVHWAAAMCHIHARFLTWDYRKGPSHSAGLAQTDLLTLLGPNRKLLPAFLFLACCRAVPPASPWHPGFPSHGGFLGVYPIPPFSIPYSHADHQLGPHLPAGSPHDIFPLYLEGNPSDTRILTSRCLVLAPGNRS